MEKDFKETIRQQLDQENLAKKILGLRKNASLKSIKKAYHILALETHPDKKPDDVENYKRFININNAYKLLMGRTDSKVVVVDNNKNTNLKNNKFNLKNSWGYYNHWKDRFTSDGTF